MLYLVWIIGLAGMCFITGGVAFIVESWEKY